LITAYPISVSSVIMMALVLEVAVIFIPICVCPVGCSTNVYTEVAVIGVVQTRTCVDNSIMVFQKYPLHF
jgi:hypothetical protein